MLVMKETDPKKSALLYVGLGITTILYFVVSALLVLWPFILLAVIVAHSVH